MAYSHIKIGLAGVKLIRTGSPSDTDAHQGVSQIPFTYAPEWR